MEWIMNLSPEITTAVIGFVIAFIGAAGTLVGGVVYMIKEFGRIKVEQERIRTDSQKRTVEQESKQSEIINTFVVDFNRKNDEQQKKADEQQKKLDRVTSELVSLQVENARNEGKISVLIDAQTADRESWNKQRSELVEKIEKLERRIAELEHENESKSEIISKLKEERDLLKTQLDDRDKKIIQLVIDLNQLKQDLSDCAEEKQAEPKPEPLQLIQPEEKKKKEA